VSVNKEYSCYVFGGDTLLGECVELLQKRNFGVRGVVSRNPVIEQWAKKKNIPYISLDSEYAAELAESPFDYLFSITHLEVIPEPVLALPGKISINFHDGPLPGYAGLNAPAWAIMNGEEQYGITWHVITPDVDEGDILLQKTFDIAPDETALSLNTKCFASALDTFPQLLDELLNDRINRKTQIVSERSYFSKYQKPEAACVIDWSKPADVLEAQIRGLNFGAYPNPVGSTKILEGEAAYVVESAVAQSTESLPGKVIRIEEGEVEVGTGKGSLTITSLASPTGGGIPVSEFVKHLEIAPGKELTLLTEDTRSRLTDLNSKLSRYEEYWAHRLRCIDPVDLPYEIKAQGNKEKVDFQFHVDNLNVDLKDYKGSKFELISTAFLLLLARTSNKKSVEVSLSEVELSESLKGLEAIASKSVVFKANFSPEESLEAAISTIKDELEKVRCHGTWLKDLFYRKPDLRAIADQYSNANLPVGIATENAVNAFEPIDGSVLTMVISEETNNVRFVFDQNRLKSDSVYRLCRQLETVLQIVLNDPKVKICDLRLLSKEEEQQILVEWNQTKVIYRNESCIHQLFEEQVARTPESIALVFENEKLTYHDLSERANRLAKELVEKGVAPDVLVGVYVERSLDLMIATLGVLKAGGAYVPLDPAFPSDRIKYMIGDSNMSVIISQKQLVSSLPDNRADIVVLDGQELLDKSCPQQAPSTDVCASDLAYVIYTSGSTGKPKGVMVEHHNVTNFFIGMDAQISHDPPGTWLAVTSLSFDISVLELFWTLTRGFKVVIYRDRDRDVGAQPAVPDAIMRRPMEFGLFMWGNDDAPGRAKYRLMLEGAKFFDENGFNSIWTPERHFHAFGGPYPNPAVTGAAIAAITNNLSIRAGSCVSPLHHPIRIAEDWAVIDNLSNGRAALAFASGWQPNDFVIKPENHKNNKSIMLEQIETVRKLWRGEKVAFENPMGDMVEISTLPRPVQKELPVWVTTAGNPETYKQAGTLGANILTHLLGQTVDELAGKIKLYREARKEAGFDPDSGHVTLMLHTFVGEDNDAVRELVRKPMKDYLRSAMKLVLDFAWSFPAFKRPKGDDTKLEDIDIKALSDEETETILDFAFERYFENSGLFGTPETCVEMINRCKKADIDEIACLLDYGVATEAVMESLPYLKQVRDTTNQPLDDNTEISFQAQVAKHNVTHLQCTPSMARMLSLNLESREALSQIDHLMVGGEALSSSLARELLELNKSTLTNMYGPTEATIWSTTQSITEDFVDDVPIGRPIANTRIYVLDKFRQPSPPGVPGEMFIGGEGVVRGYLNRPELTAERFIVNPFGESDNDRIYWTGDLARYRDNGAIDFLGRIDHQVKIRGYRIELGEIESFLDQRNDIQESVVILREDSPGDQRLVAYYVSDGKKISSAKLRSSLKQLLPDHMVPGDFVALDALPLTPNRKLDRNALPLPEEMESSREQDYAAPESELEQKIVELWQNTLKVEKVSTNDNFFDLGGHSLLIVRLHSELREALDQPVSLTDLYRFPTIRSLVEYLTSNGSAKTLKKSTDRAQRRREMTRQRRRRA
jgi:natural product biosynthesis luciferase-like monooxygenase protein